MMKRLRRSRVLSLVLIIAFLGAMLLPVAQAQSQLNVKTVGNIFVDAAGRASGENVATTIAEAEGLLTAFTSLALDAEIFSSVSIDGFAQAEKIQGVGSSAIVLRGSNAVVSLYDNINAAFRVEATNDATVRYALDSDVTAHIEGAANSIVQLYTSSGASLGTLVLLEGDGAWTGNTGWTFDGQGRLVAALEAKEQVVFNAKPVYVNDEQYNTAVVNALAEGNLAAQVVSEVGASAESRSSVDYFSDVSTRTYTDASGSVSTEVRSRAQASAMVAYDFAYETLGAASANDISVFADGKLAARANSAAEVKAYAEQGLAAYYTIVAGGRAQILASTPDFESRAEHKMTITNSASGSTTNQAQAMAEAKAKAESRVEGAFQLHGNGKLTGEFMSSIVAQAEASIHAITALDTRTEVFDSFRLDGDSFLRAEGSGDARFLLEGRTADVVLVDDSYSTMVVEAKSKAEAVFDLGANVKATMVSENVAQLKGPNGYAGMLIIADATAQANANANAYASGAAEGASQFVASAEGELRAKLNADARLIFRSQAEGKAHASESVVAEAVAKAQIGAQVLAGFKGDAVATSAVEYVSGVQANVLAEAKGNFEIQYQSSAEAATAFVFDAKGTALPAKGAGDILVLVNGQKAVAVGSADAALQASAKARYYVETNLDGQVRVLVNTATSAAASAAASAVVEIQSKLTAEAKAKSKADAFGTFKMFYDGTAVGSFVSLKSDAQAGIVSDFTMLATGTEVFTSIVAGASAFVSGGADGSSVLALENQESRLEVTDTTSAWMRIVAKTQHDAHFNLATNVEAAARSAAVVELMAENGAFLGSMIITDIEGKAAASSYFATDASSQIRAHLEAGAQVIFRTHTGIETELSAQQRTMINHAVAAGRVAGTVLIQTPAALAATAHAQAQAHAQAEAQVNANADASARAAASAAANMISSAEAAGRVTTAVTTSYYSDVQMVTAATQNRIDVTVSSTTSMGKTVIVSLDPATLASMAEGSAVILVDGQVATQASSYADILNPNDDAGASEYFVLAGEAGTQVLVSLAHFSTRTVTLKSAEESETPLFMYTTIFLGLLVAAETVVLARRRWA